MPASADLEIEQNTRSWLVLFILLTRGRTSLTLSIVQLLPRPTFEDTGSTMSACFLFRYLICFSPVNAVVEQTLMLSSTPHKKLARKLALIIFPKNAMS